ncbi:MAG: hypothetical protein WA862_03490 [Solirubrobacterales bacterium]
MRRLRNRLGLLTATAAIALAGQASIAQAEFGVSPANFKTELSGAQAGLAGAPADYRLAYKLTTPNEADPKSPPEGAPKQVEVELPPGLIANPTKTEPCEIASITAAPRCPAERAVGFVKYRLFQPQNGNYMPEFYARIFRVRTQGDEAAAFAFSVFNSYPVRIVASVDPANGYRIRSTASNINEGLPLGSASLTFWGIPQEHTGPGSFFEIGNGSFGGPQSLTEPRNRFFSTPTNCERSALETSMTLTSWQTKLPIAPVTSSVPGVTDCDLLSFDPTIAVTPENHRAGAPSGYEVELSVPQNEDPFGKLTPNLRDAVVHLPAGLAISPPQANGLDACADQQLGLHNAAPAACPDASKIGSLQIDTPLLEAPIPGSVYIGSQLSSNPESGEMYRIFLVADGPGTLIKLSGAIRADARTGQLTATFDDNPELPFSKFTLNLKGGQRASLVNPTSCGTYTTTTSLSSWAGQIRSPQSSFAIDQGCDRSAFTPGFEAGVPDPAAGAYSPFSLRVTRPEGQQNVSRIEAILPEGMLAKLAGVALCPDAAAATGNCPAASRVGTTTVGAGEGASPIYVPQPGKAPTGLYLAGPYKGAPYSLLAKVPAQAGPFDLGTVVVRNALEVDPESAQVTAKSDPLPQILGGVPIAYRDIRVEVDRPGFTVNPTSCNPMSVEGTVLSAQGAAARLANGFQTVNCERLGFTPKLSLRLKGGTKRGQYPKLRAELRAKPGQANIGRVSVALPHSEFLAQEHIKTICTRVQFAADACPAGSIYGYAKAWTPLLDQPLQGPVYLRSSSNPLPDMVAALHGQIDIDLAGRIDSIDGGIRATFDAVPDAAVSRFVLNMKGGKKSLLVNSRNLCRSVNRAKVLFDGQNGRSADLSPALKSSCGKKSKKSKKRSK